MNTNTDLVSFAWKVLEHEGLGYAITSYFNPEEVVARPDLPDEIAEAWLRAHEDLTKIERFLEDVIEAAGSESS